MRVLRRAVDAWVATPKWWKGFYLVFPPAFVVLTAATGDGRYASLWAFAWALMVAGALWLSERMRRRRGRSSAQLPERRDARGPRR